VLLWWQVPDGSASFAALPPGVMAHVSLDKMAAGHGAFYDQ
jgi:hypothetical protein